MQASIVALVAALAGIVLERAGSDTPYLRLLGDALIMGAFVIAITAFLLFMKDRLLHSGGDEIMWTSR